MRGSVVLVVLGVSLAVLYGLLLPLMDRRFPTHPRWLAGDPIALRAFRSGHRRQGLVAAAVLIATGLVTAVLR